jgi:hypothetical protein
MWNLIFKKGWAALKKVLAQRITGWLCAIVIAVAALAAKQWPGALDFITGARDAATNAIITHADSITNAVGNMPDPL